MRNQGFEGLWLKLWFNVSGLFRFLVLVFGLRSGLANEVSKLLKGNSIRGVL